MSQHKTVGLYTLAWCMMPIVGFAQSIYTQNATVTANGSTVSGQYLPIVRSTGATSYFNFTTTISVDSSGAPTATTVFSASPILLFDGLQAGAYSGYSQNAKLSGPGIGPGGTTEWSWATSANPSNASFYIGSIAKNPLAARIKKAGITYTGYNYGISGSGSANWAANCLLGISQTGNAVTIVSFSNSGCTQDASMPQAEESWSLAPP